MRNTRLPLVHQPLRKSQETPNVSVKESALEVSNFCNTDNSLLRQSPEAPSSIIDSPEEVFYRRLGPRIRIFSFNEEYKDPDHVSLFDLKNVRTKPLTSIKRSLLLIQLFL